MEREEEKASKKRRLCYASSTKNSKPIAFVPDEVILSAILPKLPIKSLMRFKSVSKSWCSEISLPSFADQHLCLSKQADHGNLLLITHEYDRQRPRSTQTYVCLATPTLEFNASDSEEPNSTGSIANFLTLTANPYALKSTKSINGLVCLYQEDSRECYVCNPNIRQVVKLPSVYEQTPIGGFSHPDARRFTGGYCGYSFGYDPERNEYKVLRLFGWQLLDRYEYEIFTLGTNSWRRLNDAVIPIEIAHCRQFHAIFAGSQPSVCVEGALHWLIDWKKLILVFDLKAEKFSATIPIPDGVSTNPVVSLEQSDNVFLRTLACPRFMQINGCLCLVDVKHIVTLSKMEFWILKDYQSCVWVKETISFPYRWSTSLCHLPAGSVPSGEILLIPHQDYRTQSMWMLSYDMKTKIFKRIKVNDMPGHLSRHNLNPYAITICSQSLISLTNLKTNICS